MLPFAFIRVICQESFGNVMGETHSGVTVVDIC
jgi:hypothetical protein